MSVSELALEKVRALAERVPVVTYVKGMAASGCYFVPMGAKRMIAHPDALIGSIGVFTMALDVEQALQHLGIGVESVPKDVAPFLSPFFHTADQDALYKKMVKHLSGVFIEQIVLSRKALTFEKIAAENIASGVLFTAQQALGNGMIDSIGHEKDALYWIKKERGRQNEVPVIDYASLVR